MVKLGRFIDGEMYHFAYKSRRKKEAKQTAKEYRDMGHKVRVVRGTGLWKKYWLVLRNKY